MNWIVLFSSFQLTRFNAITRSWPAESVCNIALPMGKVGCIADNTERVLRIWQRQNGSTEENLLHCHKCVSMGVVPVPICVLFNEIS
uniref:RxLR effector candidate protein n=1 Tax=Hyaloperonospora arabidopsidis (strain Emoy2) TaxID=559515 RepID=A0A090B8G5_HYAAE|nr:RxLR effector candidate protein [Hyaloperonospora arabidopsidis Emoy2]